VLLRAGGRPGQAEGRGRARERAATAGSVRPAQECPGRRKGKFPQQAAGEHERGEAEADA
jgi:hypothetical protein